MTLAKGGPEEGVDTGSILVGKYRIETILGRGGMGLVYRAHHLTLDEPVAIKVLRRDVSLDDETVTRFVREAQAAVRLKSEHVARVSDVGTSEDGLPFMVMEYLEGADLGELVDTNGAMAAPIAADLVLQACDALAEAHSLGIVHRDIKPTNLFVSFRPDQSPIVKVLDFGISKSASGVDLSLTQTSSMLGTPAYMSPEQMRSARLVDARTDVWSLGTVLYELVEARQPFEADSFSEMCVMVAMDAPAPLQLAPELDRVIQRCLAKHPDERYQNVAELMSDLAMFASNFEAARHYVTRAHRTLGLAVPTSFESSPAIRYPTPLPARPVDALPPAAAVAAQTLMGQTTISDPSRARRPRGRRWVGATLAMLLGVGGAIGAVAMLREDREARASQAATPAGSGTETMTVPVDAAASVTSGSVADPGTPATGTGSASSEAPPIDAGAPVASGSGSGRGTAEPGASTTTVSRPPRRPARPPPRPPRPPRRPVKPPIDDANAGTAAPATPKPRCDPFQSRTGCK